MNEKRQRRTMNRKLLCLLGVVFLASLLLTLALGSLAAPAGSQGEKPMPMRPDALLEAIRPDRLSNRQTILLWPKELSQFMSEYSSWEMWLGSKHPSSYSPRDELLVSVRAIATIVPDLEVATDEPDSDLIIVSGNPAAIGALLDRLRDHALLARVTEDSPAQRDEARAAWAKSRFDRHYDTSQGLPASGVNIRNNWVANVVWGYGNPGATICVTLTRSSSHFLTTTTTANPEGLYHAYLIWEIRDGDVIEVNDGTGIKTVSVIPLRASGEASTALVTGLASPVPEVTERTSGTPPSLEVTVGKASQRVTVSSEGMFTADFTDEPFRPGTRGFLRCTDSEGNRIFMAFGASIVNVRRDTSYGLPYGSVHSVGISSIVWGSAAPNATLIITLTRLGTFVVTRTLTADQLGSFSVSVDRLIEDGDIVEVFDGVDVRTVQVPTMTFHADPVTRIITGIAPAGIATTVPGAPHSFQISIGGNTRQVTTTATSEFSADFTANPYLAGLLGALCYTTPDGDRVYKPLFVADPLVRSKLGDWRADIILGQPDFSQITTNEVVGNRLFNPLGVHVDRSVQPNRVYVYDAGNSRVLGLSHLGVCIAGTNEGQGCTTDSDCPGSSCQIQEERAADIVLGQPSFNTSACNGDSGYQVYPDVPMASAKTLCGLREEQMSIGEGGSGATMATDAQGNLYVPDFFNNRVVRYDGPFTADTVADYVWGQADFSGITCNRGAGFAGPTDKRSLCLAPRPGIGDLNAGVAIDSAGNLWVADNENNRVLRFPFNPALGVPAREADLVLGQPDFSTFAAGTGLSQMDKPASVRVDSNGIVYVADSLNNRVLMFEPPLSNGTYADRLLGSGLVRPRGLEIDPNGGLWVNDTGNYRFVYFVDEVMQATTTWADTEGGVGVDSDGNVMGAGWQLQEVLHFSPPTYTLDAVFLRAEPEVTCNQTGSRGLCAGRGLEVAAGQLIYADGKRMLFWNNPWNLTNYQPADGVIGQPDFQSRPKWGPEFGRMQADTQARLWVIYGGTWEGTTVYGYKLPLSTGATPVFTATSPLPLQGGGVFTWTEALALGGIDVQSDCDCLWLSDEENHRVFRINDVSTQPVVDIVLGQLDVSGTQCNQGRGRDFPSQDSLCHPGALAFDKAGNLYVADHNLEFDGNLRLLEFDANIIPDAPTSAVFGIPATRVFGRDGDFAEPNCPPRGQDPMCSPWEPAFDSRGRMVIGFNCYLGPRFPMVYQDPLTNPLPIAALGDFHSMPLSARFDQFDNLYILDHNRSRILIYRDRESGPILGIPGNIPAHAGKTVSVPVNFTSNGHSIASTVFSVDFDQTCLAFDPTDSDQDGIPDAVTFNLPGAFDASVTFDGDDTDGELDFFIADLFPPLASLPDGTLATITFTATCQPAPGDSIIAPVGFSDDPSASFGNTEGQSVPGITIDGSVEILGGIPGDCNCDQTVDASDISALVLEIFDGDGNNPADTPGGTFPGDPVGCNANEDAVVDAGDISCTVLLIFYGPGSCGGGLTSATGLPVPLGPAVLSDGPALAIPDQVPALPGGRVTLPVNFTANDNSISSVVFSVDYDQAWLSFDPTDSDGDDVPDVVTFNLPGAFDASVAFDGGDTDGELDFFIADLFPPLASLSDGAIVSMTLNVGSPPSATEAAVNFSPDPVASFGDTSGQSVPGTTDDGSVLVVSTDAYQVYLPLLWKGR